jgi:hypothetical protein
MISVLSKDFDWEVKVKSAQFWTEILQQQLLKHEQVSQPLLTTLEQHQLFTALQLGLTDYEISVKAAFKPILLQLAKMLPELQTCLETCSRMKQNIECGETCKGVGSRHKRQKTEEHLPEYLDEDVDSIIEDIVMAEDTSLLAELVQQSKETAMKPPVLKPVTYAQLLKLCDTSVIDFWTMEEGEGFELSPEAKLESVLDDILQSVEGVSLVETVDCY